MQECDYILLPAFTLKMPANKNSLACLYTFIYQTQS